MEDILNIAEDLAEKIAQSPLYQEYLYYKGQLMQDLPLWKKVRDAKKLQLNISIKRKQQEHISHEEEELLSQLYSQLMLYPMAKGYWESRQALLRLEKAVFLTIAEIAPVDTVFLETDIE